MGNLMTVIDSEAIATLNDQMRGEIILPEDEKYDESRIVFNAMIDKHPAMIACCVDVADVIHAVNYGREHDLLVAVRGGEHNGGGFGICDDDLVIDLSGIKYV
jgi:FAD/FMN-containing dehydrogenase